LEDEEQDESEDEDVDQEWKVSIIITSISVIPTIIAKPPRIELCRRVKGSL
jgi:hypothetical protein